MKKCFANYVIGDMYNSIAEIRKENGKIYLFVAIDRTSKLPGVKLEAEANRSTASSFLACSA